MEDEMIKLNVKVHLEDLQEESPPDSMVYVYDQSGQYLAASKLQKDAQGETSLELPASMLGRAVKVVVGPPLIQSADRDEDDEDVPVWMVAMLKEQGEYPDLPARTTLKRLGAVQKTYRLEADESLVNVHVYQSDWAKWLTCQCVVRGRLIKRVPMPDGSIQEWGVCNACIKIYEVDAFTHIIASLPDYEIVRLRDDILKMIEPWPPFIPKEFKQYIPRHWPPPPPPPPIETFSTPVMPEPEMDEAGGNPSGGNPGYEKKSGALDSIANATSINHLRSELVANAHLVVKYACVIPWFMQWFEKDLIKCTCTDYQGNFKTTISYTCGGDHPDLYFKAVQCIGGSLHTLHDPGMVCHTYWNYTCGTEVVMETTDPAAKVCAPSEPIIPPPGVSTYVLINRIGGLLINDIDSDGLVDYIFNLVNGTVSATDAPFGATLGFRVSHSPDIPSSSLKYYRWLYNKEGDDLFGNPIWHEFGTPVAPSVGRHYADYDLTQPTKPPTFPVYILGPKSIAGKTMYEFRPDQTDLQATAPPNHVYQWPVEPIGDDINSAKINSPNLPGGAGAAVGKYNFKIEIYDNTGTLVSPTSGAFDFIVLTTKAGATRPATTNETLGDGFEFSLHIDNRKCEAIIDAPSIGVVGADPNCGFLKYKPGDMVALNFHALHPSSTYGASLANHAKFRFWIRRGINVIKSIADEVDAPIAGNWTSVTNSYFTASFTPAALLGTCKQASFAEILRVDAKATNGNRRLHEYDAGTEWAFALTKK